MSDQTMVQGGIQSVLKMEQVVFDQISFQRHGFSMKNSGDVELKLGTRIECDAPGLYRVILKVLAEKVEEYSVDIQITGYCEIDEKNPQKNMLLEKNAVAILFPYVRAELSLITAQPGMEPIVLPVVNIAAMVDQAKTDN